MRYVLSSVFGTAVERPSPHGNSKTTRDSLCGEGVSGCEKASLPNTHFSLYAFKGVVISFIRVVL